MGHFPSHGVVEMPNIRSASRLTLFSVFCLTGIFLFIFAIDYPTFLYEIDRSTIRGRALEEMALTKWLTIANKMKQF